MKSKTKSGIIYVTDFRLCDKDHFFILKGISILLVILAHFFDRYLNIPDLLPLQSVAAAVFLFCSGYGVSESFKSKSGLPHYWENKALKVWLPSLVITVIFSFTAEETGLEWVAENPLALHGWFLYLLLVEYLAFWLACNYLEDGSTRLLALYAVSLCGFFVVMEHPAAMQVFCFPTGVLFSQQGLKYQVRQMKTAGRVLLCAVLAVVSVGAYFLMGVFTQPVLAAVCGVLCYMSAAAFLCFGVYFLKKIPIFGVFVPFGIISYALYLLHEQVLTLLDGRMETSVIAAVLIGLLVSAWIFSWLCDLLVTWNKKLRRQKKTQLKGSMW